LRREKMPSTWDPPVDDESCNWMDCEEPATLDRKSPWGMVRVCYGHVSTPFKKFPDWKPPEEEGE
jgi:hypothetical protein